MVNPQSIGSLVLKSLGVYILGTTLPNVLMFAGQVLPINKMTLGNPVALAPFVLAVAGPVLVAFLGLAIIFFSETMGARLFGATANVPESGERRLSPSLIQSMVFAGVGALLMGNALTGFVMQLMQLIFLTMVQQPMRGPRSYPSHLLATGGPLFQFGFGAWLFFGARGWSRFWFALRKR